MRAPTAEEQLQLELINRARRDPRGELDRLVVDRDMATGVTPEITSALMAFEVDLDRVAQDLMARSAVAPLAWNPALGESAWRQTTLMVDFDTQSHMLPGEPGLGDRLTQAGYAGWTAAAENIFGFAVDPLFVHAAYVIDWGFGPGGVQSPAGHRNAILNPIYTEIGIGHVTVPEGSRSLGPAVNTQHVATRPGEAILTGVVFDDLDGDAFYDIGEGLGGATVTAVGSAGTFTVETWASGGYSLALPDGTYDVTIAGGGLPGSLVAVVVIDGENEKLDAIAGDTAGPGITLIGANGPDTVIGSGGDDFLEDRFGNTIADGGAGDDEIVTGAGADEIFGGLGNDIIRTNGGEDYVEAGQGNDEVYAGNGRDTIYGEAGDDLLRSGRENDFVDGGAGNDFIIGFRGADTLLGGPGDDELRGDNGDDILEGGTGNDRIFGGPGRDTFIFRFGFGEERITDFNPRGELLDFTGHGLVNGIEDLVIVQSGTRLVITAPDGGEITLNDVELALISEADFLF